MSEMTLADYQKLVAQQSEAFLQAMQQALQGDAPQLDPEQFSLFANLQAHLNSVAKQERQRQRLEGKLQQRTQQLEQLLAEVRSNQRQVVRADWSDYLVDADQEIHVQKPSSREANELLPVMRSAVERTRPVSDADVGVGVSSLAVPINFSGETIGVLGFSAEEMRQWRQEDLSAVEAIVEQVGLALENQRLFDQTQEALAETLATQQRFVRQEWSTYAQAPTEAEQDAPPEAIAPILFDAIEKGEIISKVDDAIATLAIPVQYANETIGVMGFSSEFVQDWNEDDLTAVQLISEQIGLALENQRLFDQTQEALSETQTLYDINARLNEAETLQQILEAAILPARLTNAHTATLFLYDTKQKQPRFAEVAAIWQEKAGTLPFAIGAQISLTDLDIAQTMLDTTEPIFIANVQQQTELVNQAQLKRYGQEQARALAAIPLVYQGNWIGFITIRWQTVYEFTQRDQQIYQALSTQTAVALSNRLLFVQAQERATQLEKLAQIEADLSQASDPKDVIVALVTALHQPDIVMLNHVDTDSAGNPVVSRPRSIWRKGEGVEVLSGQRREARIAEDPIFAYAAAHANEPLMLSSDELPQVTPEMRAQMAELGVKATAVLPLRSGGRWQGILSYNWREPHEFIEEELFLTRQLIEPISAVVTSNRASAETEALYQANADLNEAQTFEEILNVLLKHTVLGNGAVNASVDYFDRPYSAHELPELVKIVARWNQQPMSTFANQYRLDELTTLPNSIVFGTDPILVEDVARDQRLDENLRTQLSQRFGAKSTLFVPIVVGGVQLGYLNAIYPAVTHFYDPDIRRLMAVAGQAMIALERVRLLEQTQQRAQREQMLREITARVRGSSDIDTIMRTAVQEVGRVLGRKAFVYLESQDESEA